MLRFSHGAGSPPPPWAGERRPTRPARTWAHPSPAPGRPCHVPVSSSRLLMGTRPRLSSLLLCRRWERWCFVPRFAGSDFIGGLNLAGTTKLLRSRRRHSAATASGTKRKELRRIRVRALQLGPRSEARQPSSVRHLAGRAGGTRRWLAEARAAFLLVTSRARDLRARSERRPLYYADPPVQAQGRPPPGTWAGIVLRSFVRIFHISRWDFLRCSQTFTCRPLGAFRLTTRPIKIII